MLYLVYELSFSGVPVLVALVLKNGKVVGGRSGYVEQILKENGWPNKSPDEVLHSPYLWAAKDS